MKRASVASTNQAASAESLQHQTPSLENLLARSKIFDDHIPEVVSDDIPTVENQGTTGEFSFFQSVKVAPRTVRVTIYLLFLHLICQ